MLISVGTRYQFIKGWKYLWQTGTNWLAEIWDYGPLVRTRDWGESLNAPLLSLPLRWHMTLKQVTSPQKWCCFSKTRFLQKLLRDSLWRESPSVLLHNEQYGWLKNQSHTFMQCERHSLLSQMKSCAKSYSSNIFSSLNQAIATHRLWLRNDTSL